MANKLSISIIIPFYGDLDGLRATLHALQAQTWPAEDRETLVVNNGQPEAVDPLRAAHPGVQWLHEAKVGSYAARNRGLRHARGEVIAFTDSDCVPDPTWLSEGVRALGQPEATILGGRIVYLEPVGRPLNVYEKIEEAVFLLGRQQFLIEKLNVAATANLFARRSVFDRVGPFNAQLKSFGDGDWTRRATGLGEKLAYAPGAIVRHPRRSSWPEIKKKWLRVAGGRISQLQSRQAPARSYLAALFVDSWLDPRLHGVSWKVRGLGPAQRLKFLAVLEWLSLCITAEKIRVLLGAEADRG